MKHLLCAMITISAIYVIGFFAIYPVTARFVVGTSYAQFVAVPAIAIHRVFYEPIIRLSGQDSFLAKVWFASTLWWCNRINGKEYCDENIGQEAT